MCSNVDGCTERELRLVHFYKSKTGVAGGQASPATGGGPQGSALAPRPSPHIYPYECVPVPLDDAQIWPSLKASLSSQLWLL